MRKIAFITGGYGPLSPELKRRYAILQNAASTGTRVDMYCGKGSIESRKGEYKDTGKMGAIESELGLACGLPRTVKVVVESEEEGYDAVILACGGHPGLFAIREVVSIPVVGPGTTARHVCSLVFVYTIQQ